MRVECRGSADMVSVCHEMNDGVAGLSNSSDTSVKIIIEHLNSQRSFVIEDLDAFHVVIKADEEQQVRAQVDAEVGGEPVSCYAMQANGTLAGKERVYVG